MFDDRARRFKDRLLTPFASHIGGRIHPTTVTVLSLIPGLTAASLAAIGRSWWAVAFFLINRILDGLDGFIARRRNLQSDLGGYIDLIVDFLVYATIPIGVWWGSATREPLPLIVLLATFYVNAASWMVLSAILEKRNASGNRQTSVAMPKGLIEGTETVLLYSLFLVLPRWSSLLFLLMAAGTAVGIVQRLLWARRSL